MHAVNDASKCISYERFAKTANCFKFGHQNKDKKQPKFDVLIFPVDLQMKNTNDAFK